MKALPRNDRMIKLITVPFPISSLKKFVLRCFERGQDVHMTTISRRLRF